MAFDVQEYRALVELLYKHPEWRTELRQLLLPEEILTLPQLVRELAEIQKRHEERLTRVEDRLMRLENVVAELAEAQRRTEQRIEELAEAQRRTEQRVEELAEAQRRTEQRVEELAEAQRRTEQQIEELAEAQQRTEQQVQRLTDRVAQNTGELLELKYYNRAAAYFWRILTQAHVINLAELEESLHQTFGEEWLEELARLDLIVRGRLRPPLGVDKGHPEAYLAVEVSAVVDREDVERALRRAELLRQAGLLALPVAAGGSATAGAREIAETKGVIIQIDGWTGFLDKALEKLGSARHT